MFLVVVGAHPTTSQDMFTTFSGCEYSVFDAFSPIEIVAVTIALTRVYYEYDTHGFPLVHQGIVPLVLIYNRKAWNYSMSGVLSPPLKLISSGSRIPTLYHLTSKKSSVGC
jgi:hypothetical protein